MGKNQWFAVHFPLNESIDTACSSKLMLITSKHALIEGNNPSFTASSSQILSIGPFVGAIFMHADLFEFQQLGVSVVMGYPNSWIQHPPKKWMIWWDTTIYGNPQVRSKPGFLLLKLSPKPTH